MSTQPFTAETIVRVVAIIRRIEDSLCRNKVAINLCEALHEAGILFDEAALLQLCRFERSCPLCGGLTQ